MGKRISLIFISEWANGGDEESGYYLAPLFYYFLSGFALPIFIVMGCLI